MLPVFRKWYPSTLVPFDSYVYDDKGEDFRADASSFLLSVINGFATRSDDDEKKCFYGYLDCHGTLTADEKVSPVTAKA